MYDKRKDFSFGIINVTNKPTILRIFKAVLFLLTNVPVILAYFKKYFQPLLITEKSSHFIHALIFLNIKVHLDGERDRTRF